MGWGCNLGQSHGSLSQSSSNAFFQARLKIQMKIWRGPYIFQNNYQILAFCIRLHFVFDFKDVVYLDIHIWCSTESHIDVQYKIWVLKQNQNRYVNWRPQCTFNSSDVDFINRRAVKKIIHRPDLPHRQLDDQPCYYIFTDRVAVRTERQQGMLFWDP